MENEVGSKHTNVGLTDDNGWDIESMFPEPTGRGGHGAVAAPMDRSIVAPEAAEVKR